MALLALLALPRSTSVSRDQLLGYLWPESDEERARHRLSNSLYLIKKTVGNDAIVEVGDGLRLNPERVRVDVTEFERAVAAGALEKAVPLYAGPFLGGFFLKDTPEFDRWVEGERARLAHLYARTLAQLAEEAVARGEARRAVDWWRMLAAHDPHDARVTMHLMEALEAAGNRAGAIRHAELYAAQLRQDLELEPDPEVMAFSEELRQRPTSMPERAAMAVAHETAAGSDEPLVTEPPSLAAAATMPVVSKRWYAVAAVALAAVIVSAVVVFRASDAAPVSSDLPRIVVLPLANLSGAEEDYFAEGMTEEITSRLAGISGLRVIARQTAIRYEGTTKSAREIGDELDVDYVLQGTVRTDRTSDGRGELRITPQLIRTADESPVWTDAITAPLVPGAIFDAQARIAARIAEGMGVALLGSERDAFGTPPNVDAEAYGYYLRAMSYVTSGDILRRLEDLQLAVDLFERAVETDPGFAAALRRWPVSTP